MTEHGKPGSKPAALQRFGKPEAEREATMSAYGQQLGDLELALDDEETVTRPVPIAPTAKPTSAAKPAPTPNLEPVSDDAHRHRRVPTQPPSVLQLALDDGPTRPSEPSQDPSPSPSASQTPLPPPPKLAPRHSPAPRRMGLLSADRITNILGCAAIGLAVMIFPAKQLANSYAISEVEPKLADLQGAIDHPLGVDAGLVTKPETIAANIREGIGSTRTRFAMIWLLVGLPLGVGLSFVPRP